MGIYDRDYERDDHWRGGGGHGGGGGIQLRWPESMVNRIVLVTVIAYLIEVMFFNGPTDPRTGLRDNRLFDVLALQSHWYYAPWQVFQLLTYALVHDNMSVWHVLGNMFGLWMFGREIERRIGGREFLLFYLGAVLAGGLVITAWDIFSPLGVATLGASAGTVAVIVLFALLYPKKTVYLYFALPVPMWLVGAFIVGADVMRALGSTEDNVSFQGHLGGAAFAAVYFFQQLRLSDWVPAEFKLPSLKSKPKLRVHHGYEEQPVEKEDKLDVEVDRLLAKIKEQGADSLTAKEKRVLERASREYQGRRRL